MVTAFSFFLSGIYCFLDLPPRSPCLRVQGWRSWPGSEARLTPVLGAQCRKQTQNSPIIQRPIHGTWPPKWESHSLPEHEMTTSGVTLRGPGKWGEDRCVSTSKSPAHWALEEGAPGRGQGPQGDLPQVTQHKSFMFRMVLGM